MHFIISFFVDILEKEQALKEIEEVKKREELEHKEKEEAKQKIRQAIEMIRSLGASDEQIEKTLGISLKEYGMWFCI